MITKVIPQGTQVGTDICIGDVRAEGSFHKHQTLFEVKLPYGRFQAARARLVKKLFVEFIRFRKSLPALSASLMPAEHSPGYSIQSRAFYLWCVRERRV